MQETTNLDIQNTIFIVAFIILLLICFIGFVLVIFYYKRKKLQDELQKQFSQTLLQSQIEIQEQTLQHISRELHDNLGQVASLIKINLNTLQLSDEQKTKEKVEDTKELIRQMIHDIKSLSVSLGSDRITQIGLAKALESEAERLNKMGTYAVSYELQGDVPSIDNDKAVILYRMAQEVLNNIVKHSQAKNIHMLLSSTPQLFTLIIQDDGVGFDVNENIQAAGAGLRNLRSRASLINAQLQVQSSPGNGTHITIELPL
ncbi:MAG: sensor histidine kinase [Ferruginibacter sp.]